MADLQGALLKRNGGEEWTNQQQIQVPQFGLKSVEEEFGVNARGLTLNMVDLWKHTDISLSDC